MKVHTVVRWALQRARVDGFDRRLLSSCVALVLAACSGGGGGGGDGGIDGGGSPDVSGGALFGCSAIGGGGATTSASCVNCPGNAVVDPSASVDRDFASATELTLYHPDDVLGVQGQVTLKGTAQSGVVFPGGGQAGLVLRVPSGDNVAASATINTYLDGALQDSRLIQFDSSSNGELVYFGFDSATPTTAPFDAVGISITESAPGVEEHVYRVYEFCSERS